MMTRSIGGSASNDSAGAIILAGPAKLTGDARVLQTGSRRMLTDPIWSRKLEWPIHVNRISPAGARGEGNAGLTTGNADMGAWSARHWVLPLARRSSAHLKTSRRPCGFDSGHGFLNFPFGVRCVGAGVGGCCVLSLGGSMYQH